MSFIDDILDVLDEFEQDARKKFKKGLRDKIKTILEPPKKQEPKEKLPDPLDGVTIVDADYEIVE